jgi:hypothetical protein
VRSRRHDPGFRAQLLAALHEVFTAARRQARPVLVAAGRGACGSLNVNCYWGDARAVHVDPTVSVLRLADPQGHPITVLIHFACRGDDLVYGVISAGFAGATAAVVRQVYGPLPVFHLNGCGADHFPCFAEPTRPALETEAGGADYRAALAPYVEREYARFGRALGGEVCKVLAELAVAGQQLLTLNERWRYTSWAHTAPGHLLESPLLRSVTVPVSLQCAPLPPPEECDGRVRSLEAELRRLVAHLPRTPRTHDYPLRAEETSTPLYQAMEVGSARAYWGIVAGRAKLAAKHPGTQRSSGDVTVVALDREVAIVGVPGSRRLKTSLLR